MSRTSIGVYEAKNKLSELLDRVQAGESIALTRRGKEIALIVPIHQGQASTREAIARLRSLRVGSRLNGISIKALRDEGRP